MAETCSGLNLGTLRRKREVECIQAFCEATLSVGPLSPLGNFALREGVDVAVEAVVVSVVVADALHGCPNPTVPVSKTGRPSDGNGAARTEVTRRSIPVAREKERIFLPLLVCQ